MREARGIKDFDFELLSRYSSAAQRLNFQVTAKLANLNELRADANSNTQIAEAYCQLLDGRLVKISLPVDESGASLGQRVINITDPSNHDISTIQLPLDLGRQTITQELVQQVDKLANKIKDATSLTNKGYTALGGK